MMVEGMRLTCAGMPVQFEGMVDGSHAYFRARYTSWEFTIARPGDNAVWPEHPDGALFSAGGEYDEDGCGYCAGWMDHEVAAKLIAQSVAAFRLSGGVG